MQIGLSSWIIQDGNYPDFAVGDAVKFALEFHAPRLQRTTDRAPALIPSHPAHYRMSACVRYSHSKASVVDFGCLACRVEPISDIASVGEWVSGEVYVGVDPFFYMESLHALPGIPELRYDWRIEEILLETTPLGSPPVTAMAGSSAPGMRDIARFAASNRPTLGRTTAATPTMC